MCPARPTTVMFHMVCLKAPRRTSVPRHLEQVPYVRSDMGAVRENKTRADNVL